ncbi:spore germination protein [Sporosarcina sp. ANT_H38]|uniref:spore germination protein n=1 Tax=Sporosarcina sp. ANT_H38 TaxID=2597358 RepID=UPI0011F224E6|nr:spore germination protein [Sporosarcina sp. ANT_H38]KAA0964851.1 spore germination protein [Sporosarcina sp. ANT_H38]
MGFSNDQNDKVLITIDAINAELDGINDAVFKDIQTDGEIVTVIYLSSLIDNLTLHRTVIAPLLTNKDDILKAAEVPKKITITSILSSITDGDTIVYFHEKNLFVTVNTYSPPTSSIAQSDAESTVSGPRDVLTESLQTNLSLIKRRIKNTNLKSRDFIIGTETNTKLVVVYMETIVHQENLDRVFKNIDEMDWPGFNDITIVSQIMETHKYSPFTQYHMTERPDFVTSSLLDGRIVIMMENTQGALICPSTFFEFFMSPEDEYNRWTTATLLRCLRFFGFFLTIMLTPFYISALSFHPEILPFEILINLQESRSKVPFPPVIEVLFMELVIEVLREAGSRMPTKIGQTIGIVGGIVIGTAAVEAGLVSNTLIVLVAISALLSFLPPSFTMSNSSRVIRYLFIISAGIFGLYGQMIAFAWLMIHLLNLTSLGTPYMTPLIPRKWSDLMDNVIRLPIHLQKQKKGVSRAMTKKVPPTKGEK